MVQTFEYKPLGVCAGSFVIKVEGDIIRDVKIIGDFREIVLECLGFVSVEL